MGTGKKWIAGLLAVLIATQGFSIADLSPLGMQKVLAGTVKQPTYSVTAPILPQQQAKTQKAAALTHEKTAAVITSGDKQTEVSTSKFKNSDIKSLHTSNTPNAVVADTDRTTKTVSKKSQFKFLKSGLTASGSQSGTIDNLGNLTVLNAASKANSKSISQNMLSRGLANNQTTGSSISFPLNVNLEGTDKTPAAVATAPMSENAVEAATPASISIPTNISVSSTDTTLKVSWDAVADAQSYDVSMDGTVTNVTEASYTYGNLVPNSLHTIKVRAVASTENSEWSTEIIKYTLLAAPSNITSDISGTSVNLAWGSVSGASGYEIYRDDIKVGTSESNTYSDIGLEVGTTYVYRIKAFNEAGNMSGFSNFITVSIVATTTPAAILIPANINLTSTDTTLTVSWDAVADAQSYDVSLDGNITNVTASSYAYSSLVPNSLHTVKVRAVKPCGNGLVGDVNGDGIVDALDFALFKKRMMDSSYDFPVEDDMWAADLNGDNEINALDFALFNKYMLDPSYTFPKSSVITSEWSNEISTYTLLAAPVNLVATPSSISVDLAWEAVNGATGYEVYRDNVKVGAPGINKYSDSELKSKTTYSYTVKAINTEGNVSLYSKPVTVTTCEQGVISENTTWTLANSPYILKSSITIPSGVTLTVEPGVIVKSTSNNYGIDVQGKLIALGTTGSDIVFTTVKDAEYGGSGVTGSETDYWGGINVVSTGEFIGEHVKIRYGGEWENNHSTLSILGKLSLVNSEVSNSNYIGVYLKTSNDIIIKNTKIDCSGWPGIYIWNTSTTENGTVTLENNIITSDSDGISIGLNGAENITIKNNTIDVNSRGIWIGHFGTGNLSIQNNSIISKNGSPIYVDIGGVKSSVFSGINNNTYPKNPEYNQVVIGGSLKENFTLTSGTYYMSKNIDIIDGATLTVEPGVIVKSTHTSMINVQGKLIALGTTGSAIVFTTYKDSAYGGTGVTTSESSNKDYWVGISVSRTGEFVGDNVKVRYGCGKGTICTYGKLTLINSEVSNSFSHGVYIDTTNDTTIKNTVIYGTNESGIYGDTSGVMTLKNNTISLNLGLGIRIDQNGTKNMAIESNTIFKTSGGISVWNDTNAKGNITIRDNAISQNSFGLELGLHEAENATVENNTIFQNSNAGISLRLYGEGNVIIENNNVSENKYGIRIYQNNINLVDMSILSIEKNSITNNRCCPIYIDIGVSVDVISIVNRIQNNTYTGNVEYNGIGIGGWTSSRYHTLNNGTYYLCDNILVKNGDMLTIQPGTIILGSKNNYIDVEGKLIAQGTAEKPIVFTSLEDPKYGGHGVSKTNERWDGIKVKSTGEFIGDNIKIRYGNGEIEHNTAFGTLNVEGKLTLTNSEITNSYGYGIYFKTTTAPILLYNTFNGNSYGIYNEKYSTMPIDARFNYWGSYYGPSVYPKWYGEGEGDTVGDGIAYYPWLGSEMNHKFYFGQSGINSATGNYSRTYTDLTVVSPGFDIAFSRTYNSQNDKASSLGKGWTFSYEGSVKDEEYTYVDFLDGTTKTAINSNIKAVTLPDGKMLSFSVNTDGSFTANNSRYTLKKQADGTFILTAKDQSKYLFNSSGYLVKMQDKNGNAVTLNVDSNGRVQGVTDQVGRHYTVTYENGLIKKIIDEASNRTVAYDYTSSRLTKVTDPMGNPTFYYYDSDGFVTEVRDSGNKLIEAVTYNHSGENKDKVNNITDVNGNVLTYSYDNINRRTTITDSKGRTSRQEYDIFYSITGSTDAEGKTSVYEYSKESGINKYAEESSVRDRNGNTTKYDRDGKGNITKITNPDQTTKAMTYDSNNNLTSEKDESGKYTFYIYDSEGNIVKKVQPLNGTDIYDESKDADSNFAITRYHYYTDAECQIKGLLEAETDPEGNTTVYTYDAYGNIKTVKDAENNITTFEYNPAGQVIKKTTAKGNITSYVYDKNGNLEKQIQDGNKVTRITYDSENRKTKEVSPKLYNSANDNISDNEYNGDAGNRYTYYASGKVKTKTDAANNTTSYTYDIYGNLATQTNPNGAVYSYEYDCMDRPVKKYFQDNQASEKVLLEEYSYDILTDGKTKKTQKQYLNSKDVAITEYTYDYADRLISQKNADNTTASTSYNKNGTVNSTTDEKGNTTYYKYDSLNRLTEQWTPFETVSGAVRYSYNKIVYDKAGRKKNEIAGKDTVTLYAAALQLITKTYDYYNNGKVKSITDNEGRKTEYEYDADGNVSKETVYTSTTDKNVTEFINNYLGKVSEKKVHVKAGDLAGNDFNSTEDTILRTVYTYDKNGNLETVTTPDDVTTTCNYDNLNRQTGVSQPGIDENEQAVTIASSTEYDCQGNVVKTTDANGNITEYHYNQRGLLETTTDAETNTTAFYYDRVGRKIAEVAPKDYDPAKTLSQMNRVEYTYDLMGRVKTKTYVGEEKKVDPVTHEWVTQQVSIVQKAYQYDNNGNVTKELDGLGLESATDITSIDTQISTGYGTEYTYNLADKPITVKDAVSKDRGLSYTTKYSYDALGRKTSETYANGVIKNYNYDDAGNVTKLTVQKTSGSAEQTIQINTYDYVGNLLTKKYGNGNTTTYEYNALGKLRKTTAPGDITIPESTIISQYDAMGRLKIQKDSRGAVNTYTYNNQGDVLSQKQQAEDGKQAITTSTRYDKNGNARYVTDGNQNTTENIYNVLNKISTSKQTVSGVMHETAYGYDANGNQTTVTDWRGNTSQNVYDSLNRHIEKKDAYGKSIQKLEYNHSNVQEKSYDALNNVTQYTYDKNNRLLSTTDPENHTTSQTYDNAGNIQTKTDARGNISPADDKTHYTTYTYDEFNRLKTVTNSKNETTSYTYDLNGNLLTQTDGRGNITTYEYNAANKVAKRIDQGGRTLTAGKYDDVPAKTEAYTYNADGNLATKTDRNGITTTYTYDIHGRLLSQTTGNISISYTYDGNGNQLTMTDSTGTTTRTYDEQNRVLTKNVPNIGITTFEYDKITGMEEGCQAETSTDPKGNLTQKTYDMAGRLKTVTADGKTTTYNYLDNGARQSVIYNDGSREDYTYYADGLLRTLTNKKADGSIIDTYSYTYDAAHNQASKTDSNGTTNYTYDTLNRLETVTEPNNRKTTYTYDAAGNRATETITVGGNATVNTYTYNEQDHLTQIVTTLNGTTTATTVYTYDNNGNQLTTEVNGTVTVSNTYDARSQLISTTTGGITVQNTYNGDGYRVEKAVNGAITRYLYEYDKVVLELDGSGNQTGRNVYGTNLLMRSVDGTTYYYMYNGHADVTALLKPDGTIAATYYYDAFGNITDTTGAASNSITFAGYQYDKETGLYYLNARMYDPKTARFLQEDTYTGDRNDPLSLNLYVYCANNPLIYYDPTGHSWMDSARDWFLNDTSAGRWVNKNIVKPVKKKAKAVYNYLDEKVPVLTGIGEALYDEAKTITDSVDIVGKVIDVAKVITHPKETIKQIGDNYKKILADPKAVWNSVASKVTNYVDTNIINGNAHTRAEFGTHAAVFIGSFFVGGSESEAGTAASKFAESAKGLISKTNGLTNRIIYEETGSTNIFNKMFSRIAENKIPEVNRGLSAVGEGGSKPPNLSPEGAGRNGAFREAKRNSDIPVTEQPKKVTPAVDKRGNRIPGKDYDFGDGKVIRDHSGGHEFPDDPSQNRGPHFNDPDGNHYDYNK
ncbi:right-handed parallel beta-helix repeat-containing protein [Ruminiclostridium papyrosolvens]|uniref:cellulase n=1 Tax=Ruminiclostridium papyrosolvens C7 TaxID=1330534 RepID=U4QYE4_9FIRM|nr:right-handed parallel beta-helix repeat-containing protein [Ruminiclostridium papyrosolvens]EPR08089.1 hypothetical protein L323_18290 [Ruminiclostridium papyrosolvens C7]